MSEMDAERLHHLKELERLQAENEKLRIDGDEIAKKYKRSILWDKLQSVIGLSALIAVAGSWA